jgi:glycosyltransferase involved in cell wall biosynthesis
MIVKDEAHVIERCLFSVLPLIDYAVIEDTGSSDATQEVVQNFFKDRGIRVDVFSEPWKDFAHNRNLALQRLRTRSDIDYALVIDADDVVILNDTFSGDKFRNSLDQDFYHVQLKQGSISYWRPQLFKNSLDFYYKGILHEFIQSPHGAKHGTVTDFSVISNREGSRSLNPNKYRDDALKFEEALRTEDDPFLIARYTFYLAQSWRDAGQAAKALKAYLARSELGYWDEERYVSLLCAGRLMQALDYPDQEVIKIYRNAQKVCPNRLEAMYEACKLCRIKGYNEQGYVIGLEGISITGHDGLFVEEWIYNFGLKDEFAINAYWSEHFSECLSVCIDLLGRNDLPAHHRERIKKNALFAQERLPKSGDARSIRLPTENIVPWSIKRRAVDARRTVDGLVSIITPTRNRKNFIEKAAKYVNWQSYADVEWLIIDDSDPGERHRPSDVRGIMSYECVDKRLTIGEKRNLLVDRARGEYIIHFDDDDFYSPHYVATMLEAMRQNSLDLMNLRGWYLFDERNGFFGYWNLESKTGLHYRCARDGISVSALTNDNNAGFECNHMGFGFSYAFKKSVWERGPFPHRDWNEDGEFFRFASQYVRTGGVHDIDGICLHIVHPNSTSISFPQYRLPEPLAHEIFREHFSSSTF